MFNPFKRKKSEEVALAEDEKFYGNTAEMRESILESQRRATLNLLRMYFEEAGEEFDEEHFNDNDFLDNFYVAITLISKGYDRDEVLECFEKSIASQ